MSCGRRDGARARNHRLTDGDQIYRGTLLFSSFSNVLCELEGVSTGALHPDRQSMTVHSRVTPDAQCYWGYVVRTACDALEGRLRAPAVFLLQHRQELCFN